MSESVVRLPAQQSLFNATSNLVDLIIPGNTGVYDLSQTYVSLLTRITSTSPTTPALIVGADDGVYDIRVHMKHGNGQNIYNDCATPIECLVNSCSMISATKGGIEDIRKSDVLRGTLSVYKEDLDSRQAKALTTWSGACKDQPWVHGQNVQLRGEGNVKSREVTHEIRFNLKDLFDAGQFDAWDSSVYGDTRIHLELNLGQVTLTQCQGADDITWTSAYQQRVDADGTTADLNFGYVTTGKGGAVVLPKALVATDTFAAVSSLEMKTAYDSLADSPWWVGQDVSITPSNTAITGGPLTISVPLAVGGANQSLAAGTANNPTVGAPGRAVITSIDFDKLTGLVTLNFAGTILECPAQATGAGGTLSVSVKGTSVSTTVVPSITYEACELVATMRSDLAMGQAPKAHQFSRFVFQGDQFSNTTGIQRTYQIPANCTAVVMAITNTDVNHSSFLGSAQVNDYRFSIDGEAVTNRAVPYSELGGNTFRDKWGSSIHYDLLQKTFLNMGSNARYQSMTESIFDQKIPVDQPGDDGTALIGLGKPGWTAADKDPQKSAFVIGVPIPLKNESSQLLLELNGVFTDGASINIYSYVQVVV